MSSANVGQYGFHLSKNGLILSDWLDYWLFMSTDALERLMLSNQETIRTPWRPSNVEWRVRAFMHIKFFFLFDVRKCFFFWSSAQEYKNILKPLILLTVIGRSSCCSYSIVSFVMAFLFFISVKFSEGTWLCCCPPTLISKDLIHHHSSWKSTDLHLAAEWSLHL